MPATLNAAALFYQQYDKSVNLTSYTPFPCTVTEITNNGARVQVVVKDTSQPDQSVGSSWVENNVPFVETGHAPPASGFFVTAVGYSETPPVTLSSIAFNMTGGTSVAGDGTTRLPFAVIATMSDSSTQDVTAAVVAAGGVTINPTTGLTVSSTPNDAFVGTVAGSYTATATYEGKTATQAITVT